ncbi:hypothetical protein QBC34DRAFT_442718 [Podospora aff. communis PSN243]|uniref:DUF676 domain-containing protein n=1 Tax=Podospora aff. communis PSN243 TaxID=3040156 RepID=A0AAV9GAC4_9PEZI|nr:hypothetical protein QBC34DRAFT_442718 [Podospora aff. communis PSN243]
MKRVLLLCFIHGFKGDDDTFREFPKHLQDTITSNLPDDKVTSVVYPKYETKGELAQSTSAFLGWLREQVMNLRKEHVETPWPPNDRSVGVILVAHSMGGFVASDCLFQILDERRREEDSSGPIFPLIQGILAFDTPYNGLARSMFVYGAFSNYHKVSSVFNVMTALSAAAPATLSRLATKRVASSASKAIAPRSKSSPGWKAWQLIAVRTGTVGAIAAGGVAAYVHRKQILEGVRSVRNLKKEDVVQGYQQSVDALGQGLAYINKGNVGESFAWLSAHFTFVGALLKQNELNRRLERLAALKGVGIRDFYASLGENGYWSGGYFVPERTFCAVPVKDQPGAQLFQRHVVEEASDEIVAHINLFKREKNPNYERMLNDAARLAVEWFEAETSIYDDPKFAEPPPPEPVETEAIAKAVDEADTAEAAEEKIKEAEAEGAGEDNDGVPDESPIDIAAAASLVPLPDDDMGLDAEGGDKSEVAEQKQAYLRHLFGIAQETGTSLWSNLPSKLPTVEMPKVSMPSVTMPSMPSMPSVSMPKVGLFSKKSDVAKEPETAASPVAAETADAKLAEVEGVPVASDGDTAGVSTR